MFCCKGIRVLKNKKGVFLNAQDFINKCEQILKENKHLNDNDIKQVMKNIENSLGGTCFRVSSKIVWYYSYEEILEMLYFVDTGGVMFYITRLFTPTLLQKISEGKKGC